MSIAIFVGPSFPNGHISKYLTVPAVIYPPIRRGELASVAKNHQVIAIIDGVFHSDLSVSAREILLELRNNKVIYGCSSMGALRAAELDIFGMIGIGDIYKQYANRTISSDGDVALLFDPISYENLTIPMVNIRFGIQQAIKHRVIGPSTGAILLEFASQIHYTELDYASIIKRAKHKISQAKAAQFLQYIDTNKDAVDLKKLDGLELIQRLNNAC